MSYANSMNRVVSDYSYCRVEQIVPNDKELIKTVEVILQHRDGREKILPYKSKTPVTMMVEVARLVLIVLQEDIKESN